MRRLVIVLVILSIVFGLDLTFRNFDETLSNADLVVVDFYAPWCQHCMELKPEFEKLTELFKNYKNVKLGKLNCDSQDDQYLCQKYGVQSLPSIKLFKKGEYNPRNYDGDRSFNAMKEWLLRHGVDANPFPVNNMQDVEDLKKKATDAGETIVIGFFPARKGKNYYAFVEAAQSSALEDFILAEAIDVDHTTQQNHMVKPGDEELVMWRFFEGSPLKSKDFTSIANFTIHRGYPPIDELSSRTYHRFSNNKLPVVMMFVNTADIEPVRTLIEKLKPVAEAYRGELVFFFSDGKQHQNLMSKVGLNPSSLPRLAVTTPDGEYGFPYKGDMNANDVKIFLKQVIDGKITAFVKSQDIPVKNDAPVKVIVRRNFQDLVMETENRDVLVQFYQTGKEIVEFEVLANKYLDIPDLNFGKMDVDLNEIPFNMQIPLPPSFLLFPAGKKMNPVAFDGAFDAEKMHKFLVKYAIASKDELKQMNKRDEL
jgi:protein disulfide isomerase